MAGPWMTAAEALAWIMFRDTRLATDVRHLSARRFSLRIARHKVEAGFRGFRQRRSAEQVLIAKCSSQHIRAAGIASTPEVEHPRRQLIGPLEWSDLKFNNNSETIRLNTKPELQSLRSYINPEFNREDILRAFPPVTRSDAASEAKPTIEPISAVSSGGHKALAPTAVSEMANQAPVQREQVAAPTPVASGKTLKAAAEALAEHLRGMGERKADFARAEGWRFLRTAQFEIGSHQYRTRIWPTARSLVGLDGKAKAGRKRKSAD